MEVKKTVQPVNRTPVSCWSSRRVCIVLVLLLAVIFAALWLLTPIGPYATLKLDEGSGLIQFSPDGTMLVTSGKREVYGWCAGPLRVWDVEQGQERFALALGWKEIYTVSFSPDSRSLAALDRGGDFKLWNARTSEEIATLTPETKRYWMNFQFSPDGRFLVFQDNKAWPPKQHITFWNVETKHEQASLEGCFYTLVFAPEGDQFATFLGKDPHKMDEALLWKMDRVPVLVKQHRITASVGAFSPDLKVFVTADELPDKSGQIAMWDTMTGEKLWSMIFNERGTRPDSLSFIANGKVLAAQSGWHTTLWDVSSQPKEIGSFSQSPPPGVPIFQWSSMFVISEPLAVSSPDGEWLAVPLYSGAKLINGAAPERGAVLNVDGDWPTSHWPMPSPSFSPDSKMIVVTGLRRAGQQSFLGDWLPEKYNPFRARPDEAVIRVWDTESHRQVAAFSGCNDAWFSPDGKVFATLRGDSKAIDLWRVPFRASLWHIFGWAVIAWLIVVAGGWAGVKMHRKMFSRTNAPLLRPESSDGKQPPFDVPHEPPPS